MTNVEETEETTDETTDESTGESEEEEFDREEIALEVTRELLGHFIEDISLEANTDERNIRIKIESEEAGLIIGRKGSTLDAIQFLVQRIVDRTVRGQRIILEAGGYREQHEEQIEALAKEAAEAARDQGRSQAIENLTGAERRIVHMVLQEDDSVTTESRGEGEDRILVISPV